VATYQAEAQPAPGKKVPIKIIYSALTASNGPVWLAGDQGLYEKYGLDVQIVHGRGALPIQGLAGGTVELGHFAGASVISANLGGSDLVFVGAQSNYVVLSIWTRKDSPIKSLADLAGKNIGVSAPGSATHTTTRAALRKAGVADKDIKFVHHIPPDVARGAYRSFANVWEEIPYVGTDAVQAILDFLPKEQVKDVTPEKYIDNSLIKELETSGFIKGLSRR